MAVITVGNKAMFKDRKEESGLEQVEEEMA